MHGVGIVIGAIIGVGIFITPSKVATIAGSPEQALLMWLIDGLLALTGSLCMAQDYPGLKHFPRGIGNPYWTLDELY